MTTYLFVTRDEYNHESVNRNSDIGWSCSKTTQTGDKVLVYVAGRGIMYEWRAVTDAVPNKEWKFACDVRLVRKFKRPLPLKEIMAATPNWKPPQGHFRGFKSIIVPRAEAAILRAVAGGKTVAPGGVRVKAVAPTLEEMERAFQRRADASSKLSMEELKQLVAKAPKQPTRVEHTVSSFERSVYVVAAAMKRAKGVCEGCKKPAPFKKKSNHQPYLEVHHKKLLAEGGLDTLANAIALCPNCHREAHYGEAR